MHTVVWDAGRFWAKVDKSADCWLWKSTINAQGYGQYGKKINGKTVSFKAHRVAWEITHGPISTSKLYVCHRCDNPPCVRPDHLFLGTQFDNMKDMTSKGRGNAGERHGLSKLTLAQVKEIRALRAGGGLTCKAIGERYGVAHTAISRICTGKRWGRAD